MRASATLVHVGQLPQDTLYSLGLDGGSYVVLRTSESDTARVARHLYERDGLLLVERPRQIQIDGDTLAPTGGRLRCCVCRSEDVTHLGYFLLEGNDSVLGAMCDACSSSCTCSDPEDAP